MRFLPRGPEAAFFFATNWIGCRQHTEFRFRASNFRCFSIVFTPMPAQRLLTLCLLLCTFGAAQESTFRGNAAHTGEYQAEALPAAPTLAWQFETQGPIAGSPAVAGDTLYVGSYDHNLYALDAGTGKQRWKFASEGRIVSTPAVQNGSVYFGSMDSKFYAVDVATGKEKWHFDTTGERRFTAKHIHGLQPEGELMPDPFDFFSSSPTIVNGTVYFGSGDNNVYALDASTGKLRWKFAAQDVIHASPAVSDGLVLVGSWDSNFYALDAADGHVVWTAKTGTDEDIHNQVGIQSSAAVANGVVYFGCRDSNLYAVDLKTGVQKFTINHKGSWVITSPAVANGNLYFATSDSHLLRMSSAADGTVKQTVELKWPMFSSPAVAGNALYIGSHDGFLRAFDARTLKPIWEFQTNGSKANKAKYTSPDGKTNYRAAMDDRFYDNVVIGVRRMMGVGAVLGSPVPSNGMVYFTSMDGTVYALR